MTAALIMPDRQERPNSSGDSAGMWISPKALAQLFSFHVIKDLNFLSQVIKLSVTETLQPGILTKVQLKSQSSQTDYNGPASLDIAAGALDIGMDSKDDENNAQQVQHLNNMNFSNNSNSRASEDWDKELTGNGWEPPKKSQINWEDNPRMRKLYKKKREAELSIQKEWEEELMAKSESDNQSNHSLVEGKDSNGIVGNANQTKELDMNKVVRGGRKLFVRNINFKTSQHKLWEFFKKFGRVRACELAKDKLTRRSRGIGFVTFDKQEECEKALSASEEELTLEEWVLKLELARPKKSEAKLNSKLSKNWNLSLDSENGPTTDSEGNIVSKDMSPAPCDVLTDDAFLHIFSFLEIRQLMKCERVCRKWNRLTRQAWKLKQSINLRGVLPVFHSIEDREFRMLLSKCSPSLTSLDLSVSAQSITDRSLEAIARFCPNLQNISITSARITNKGFEKFVKNCSKIQKIDMETCHDVREDGIWRLLNHCRDLREVYLNNCKRISGQCFHVMAGGIATLSLSGCSKLQDVAMSKLSMRCKNLQELHLTGCTLLTDCALYNLAQNEVVDTLQILGLSKVYPHMTPEGLQRIAEFANLQEIYLSENNLLRDETLQKICSACTSLRVLDIGGCGSRITDSGLDKLPESLEYLTISYLSSVTDEGLELIADNCPDLRSLKARFCHDITNTGLMSVILLCTHLRELDVCGCFNITNDIVNGLAMEQKLRVPPVENVLLMVGGTSIVASELSLPASITLNTFAYNPTMPDFNHVHYVFDSEEDSFDDDDFDEFLVNDDPFLMAEMEMS